MHKSRFTTALFRCLFLIRELNIVAEFIHHFDESLIHDLLPALSDAVHARVSKQTVSTWLEAPIQILMPLSTFMETYPPEPHVQGNKSTGFARVWEHINRFSRVGEHVDKLEAILC